MTSAARLRRAADKHTPLKGQGERKTRAKRSRPLNRSGDRPLFRSLVIFLQASFCVFHSGDRVCLAKAVLLGNSALSVLFFSCHKRVIRTVSCRADLFQECFVCSCHNTSARCLSWAHCRIVLSKVNGRKSLPKCSNLSDGNARIFFSR